MVYVPVGGGHVCSVAPMVHSVAVVNGYARMLHGTNNVRACCHRPISSTTVARRKTTHGHVARPSDIAARSNRG
jgi:hypothetical protein